MTDRQANSMPEMGITDIVENLKTMIFGEQVFKRFNTEERHTLYEAIYALQSLQAISLDLAFENDELEEKLAQEPNTKNDLGVDCISRKAVKEALYAPRKAILTFEDFEKAIDNLPPVTPIRPKGHWILTNVEGNRVWYCNCSECGKDPQNNIFGSEDWWLLKSKLPKFCPNCGADMRGNESNK